MINIRKQATVNLSIQTDTCSSPIGLTWVLTLIEKVKNRTFRLTLS